MKFGHSIFLKNLAIITAKKMYKFVKYILFCLSSLLATVSKVCDGVRQYCEQACFCRKLRSSSQSSQVEKSIRYLLCVSKLHKQIIGFSSKSAIVFEANLILTLVTNETSHVLVIKFETKGNEKNK